MSKFFQKFGQPKEVDPLSLPDRSQESEVVEGVILDKKMGGRTEEIRNYCARVKITRNKCEADSES